MSRLYPPGSLIGGRELMFASMCNTNLFQQGDMVDAGLTLYTLLHQKSAASMQSI